MANTELAIKDTAVSIFSDAQRFELACRMASSLAKSTIVPKEYQSNANNALIAIELANRLQVSPLMVMQNLYVVYGRPSWSAQYVIAMINGSGKYDKELQYDEKTDKNGKPYSCRCWTTKDGREVTGPTIDMDMARAEGWLGKNGSKWQTMPQMMLRYRAASFFGRMNCPELTMGIYTKEEVVEIGPEGYSEVPQKPIEERVHEDIRANANSVEFEETVEEAPVKEEPKPAEAPKAKATATKKTAAKKEPEKPTEQATPKKEEKPVEPEVETVIDIEPEDEEEAPDWA